LVREHVPGEDLQCCWATLDNTLKQSVFEQIRRYLHELRRLSPPSETPGPPDGGLCQGRLWFSEWGAGPFATHQDLVDFWNSLYPTSNDHSSIIESVNGPFHTDYPLVFVHGNLSPLNFIWSPAERVLWAVDWAQAGWYPEY
ncbi:hypothetical protein BD414DRAFT_389995, partial [Trametes punicea]